MARSPGARNALIICAVSGITTLNVFLNGALTVGMPTIGKDLGFSQASLQWPINVFNLAFGCTLLLFGRIGDIVGGKKMFIIGSAWFMAWSIASAFAPNPESFIIFVAMKGLGGAANTPAGISIFVSHFPPGPSRNRAFGVLGAGQPLGFILGLILGGVIIQSPATWRGIFYIQGGLAFFLVVLGWIALAKDDDKPNRYKKGIDVGGAFLSTAGIALLVYALADASSAPHGWASPRIISSICLSVPLLAAFWFYELWRENRGLSVLMPPSIWKNKATKMPQVISLVFFAWWSFNTLMYFCTLYYQQVSLRSPLQTSINFIPMIISGIIANLLGGWLMNRIPGHILMVGGLCGNVIAPLLFALLNLKASYWFMTFWIMILIVGADVVYPVGTVLISSALDDDSQALGGAIFNVATRLATSIGIGATSTIANSVSNTYAKNHPTLSATSPEILMIGYRAAGFCLVAAAMISVLIGLLFLRDIGIVGRSKGQGVTDSARRAVSEDGSALDRTERPIELEDGRKRES